MSWLNSFLSIHGRVLQKLKWEDQFKAAIWAENEWLKDGLMMQRAFAIFAIRYLHLI